MPPLRGGAARRQGDRLHRALHQHVAGGGVHSHPADGRHRRPAVPRVRRHPVGRHRGLAGRLADHDADDVRTAPAAARAREARPPLPGERAGLRLDPQRVREVALLGAAASGADAVRHARDDGDQRLSVRDRSQGLLPAAGYRPPERLHRGRSGRAPSRPCNRSWSGSRQSCRRIRPSRTSPLSPAATNSGRMFVSLKPQGPQADAPTRSSPGCARSSATSPAQTSSCNRCRTCGWAAASGNAQYQYTLQGDDTKELLQWAPRLLRSLRGLPQLADVNSDQQNNGLQASLVIDRATASRLGVTPQMIDDDALRRLRPAAGLDDVRAAQPVSRGHGGRAAVLAEPGRPEVHLRARRQRQPGAARRLHSLRDDQRAAHHQSPGAVSRR